VSYRDELSAARARIAALENDLAAERERRRDVEDEIVAARRDLARLEEGAPTEAPSSALARPPSKPVAPHELGRIHYHPPRTYVPLLGLLWVGLRAVWDRAPGKLRRFESEHVAVHVLRYLLMPFYYLIWHPYFWVSLLVTAPLTFLLAALGTVALLPVIVASRFTHSAKPPADGSTWFHGEATADAGATLFAIPGFILPIFTPFALALDS
jgi:hypothetical protein